MREFSRAIDPAIADDEEWLDEFIWMHRLSASPSSAAGFARMAMETDVTDVLASIRVPSLILHTADERGPSRYVAERIHDAQIAEVGGKQRGPYSDAVAEACLPSRGCHGAFRSRFGPCDGSLHRPRRLDEARGRARRRALAGDLRRAPARGSQGTGSSSRNRGRHRRRRLLLPLRRPRASDRVRSADRGGRPGPRPRGAGRRTHGRVPGGGPEACRNCGARRSTGDGGRRAGRGPRLEHGQGPGRRIGLRVRGPR